MPTTAPRRLAALATLTLASACDGRDDSYGADTAPVSNDVEAIECGDESTYEDGWRIEGQAQYQDPAEEAADTGAISSLAGKCIQAIDPTPALAGQPPTLLGSSVICDDGSFVVSNMQANPTIGTFVVVDDCEGEEDLLMTSATGISGSEIADLGPGDALTGVTARVVSKPYRAVILSELAAAGYDGETEEGTFQFLAGRIVDGDATPLDDHTLTCGACVHDPVYADVDVSDGLFLSGGAPNTSTSAAADAFFMVPMAAIGTYSCAPSGASEATFTNTYGSLPDYAVFIEMPCVSQ